MNPFTPKVRAVIRREFMSRVKSKWFLASTLGLPVMIVGIMGLSIFLAIRGAEDAGEGKIIGVADPEGIVGDLVVEELLGDSLSASRALDMDGLSAEGARERLSSTTYDLLLLLPEGLGAVDRGVEAEPSEEDEDDARATLLALDNVPDVTQDAIRNALQRASVRARLRTIGVEVTDAGELIRRTRIDVVNVTESGEARSQRLYQGVSFGIAFLFYMILIIYGQMIVRSILEEKQSDIVEVMVSSLRPWELMLGKIVGVGAVGIAQIAIWGAIVTAAGVYGLTGGANALAEAGVDLATLSIPWGTIALVLLFLILGYLLYAGLFAGAGATISNEHDAQFAVMPITMLIIVPFMAIQGVIQSPSAGWAVIISLVPFFSPIVMTSRLFVTSVPVWQWALSLVLLGGGMLGAAWVAGRIYRVGILMKGQRPNLPEVFRWIRHG